MSSRYCLSILALCLGLAHVQAQAPKPQPETPSNPGLAFRTHHQDNPNFRGGGDGADDCANATLLTVGTSCVTIAGSAAGATQSNAPILCNGFTSGNALDVWFQFTATANSTTITATGAGDYDVVMEVFSGACGNLISLGCADATFPPNGLVETFVATTVPTQTYRVRIYSYTPPTNTSTTFTICAFSPGGGGTPANDNCSGAVVQNLAVPGSITLSGDNTGATVDAPTSFALVWHSFTITACANVALNYCVPGSVFDDFLVNLTVNCPDFLTGFLTGTVSPDNCTLTFANLPAGTYSVPVLVDATLTPVGAYTVGVTATACGGPGYCTAGADGTGLGLEERIINVTMSNINNSSPDAAPVAPAYTDFTNVVGNVVVGQVYPIAIDVARNGANTSYDSNQALVWIDFNQDLDFNDPGELVFVSTIESIDIFAGSVTIPPGTPVGTTRMRVRLHDTHDGSQYTNNFNDTPCGLASYGEVEDYTLSITSGGGSAPANDDCTGAVPVALSTPGSINLSGDNTGATVDPPTTFVVVWEAFTIAECSNVTINYCQAGSEFEAFFINVAVNCPDFVTGILQGPNDDCNVFFTNLPAGTYYIPVRVEADGTTPQGAYTIQVSAEPCAPVGPYCEASANSLQFEKISNVTFADINNASTSNAGYEDFTGVTGTVVGGQSYPISITIAGGFATDQVLAWIDWNQDQDFDDADEAVFVSAAGVGPHAGIVNVPLTAALGTTRMRVRLHDTYVGPDYFNFPNPTPCDTSTYGQVEDYTIDMIGVVTGAASLQQAALAVFPNPNDGNMTINYAGTAGTVVIEVVDATGRVAHAEQRAAVDGASLNLSLAGRLAQGAYTLRLTAPDGALLQQRVVVR